MLRHRSFAVAVAVMALVGLSPRSYADRYDTPIVSVADVSRYSVTLQVTAGATGLPAGFGVDWMTRANFDAEGGWPVAGAGMYYCDFTGLPTYNVWPGATGYALGPFETAWIEVGDLFDETGVSTDYDVELDPTIQYVFRTYGLGDADGETSYYTSTLQCQTNGHPPDRSCILSQGYWKNHPNAWPVQSLTLGTVSYTKTQLLSILNKPANGNGLIILAHQLIAAKLNVANGGDATPIAGHLANADAMIGGLVVPPVGTGSLTPSSVDATNKALDAYNNGKTDAACHVTEATPGTWGSVKARYK